MAPSLQQAGIEGRKGTRGRNQVDKSAVHKAVVQVILNSPLSPLNAAASENPGKTLTN